jgi:Ser/Thr protein kinase RdoA (MazF antagonist)
MPHNRAMHDSGAAAHPYDALTPDTVMQALTEQGLWPDGRLLALGSFENRVYRVHLDEPLQGHAALVLKFYRPQRWRQAQILEEHAFALELAQAEVPVVAPLCINGQTLHAHAGFFWSASPVRGGRAPELEDGDTLEWIGRFLARLHLVGQARPFAERPALGLESHLREPARWLAEHDSLPLQVQRAWHSAVEEAAACVQASGLDAQPAAHLRLHGDCHPGNILWTPTDLPGGGPHFVDLDDARMGPAVQDLWMLLASEPAERRWQLAALLDGYEQMRPFDRAELAWIEPLRTLRLVHYSAWLARRWSDPSFPIHFPWFGSVAYWEEQVQMLHAQIEAMSNGGSPAD